MNQYTRAGQLLTAAKEINKNRKTRKSGAAERAETDEIGSKKRTWGDRKSGEFVPGQERKKCARRSVRRSAGSKTNQEESFVEEQQADVSGIMGNETFQVLEQDVPEVQGDLMDSMERMSLDGSHTASTPQHSFSPGIGPLDGSHTDNHIASTPLHIASTPLHSFSHGIGLLDISQILADERQNVVDPHSDIYSRPGLLPVQNNTRPKVIENTVNNISEDASTSAPKSYLRSNSGNQNWQVCKPSEYSWDQKDVYFQTKGLQLVKASGDGHCFLHSFVACLKTRNEEMFSNLGNDALARLVSDLIGVEATDSHYDYFFTEDEMRKGGDRATLLYKYLFQKQYDNTAMEVTVGAVCTALGVTLKILQKGSNGEVETVVNKPRGDVVTPGPDLYMCFTNNHYDALLPVTGSYPEVLSGFQSDTELEGTELKIIDMYTNLYLGQVNAKMIPRDLSLIHNTVREEVLRASAILEETNVESESTDEDGGDNSDNEIILNKSAKRRRKRKERKMLARRMNEEEYTDSAEESESDPDPDPEEEEHKAYNTERWINKAKPRREKERLGQGVRPILCYMGDRIHLTDTDEKWIQGKDAALDSSEEARVKEYLGRREIQANRDKLFAWDGWLEETKSNAKQQYPIKYETRKLTADDVKKSMPNNTPKSIHAYIKDNIYTETLKEPKFQPILRDDEHPSEPEAFEGKPGLCNEQNAGKEPLDYLYLMIPPTFWQEFAKATTSYAEEKWKQSKKQEHIAFNEADMKLWFALTVLMGIVHKPEMTHYWSQHRLLDTPIFRKYISRNRFQDISANINLRGTTEVPEHEKGNKLYKLQPLIETLAKQFKITYKPERELSIDENSCPWTGIGLKQFNKSKPCKYHMKIYMLCEGLSSYCSSFYVYEGKETQKQNTEEAEVPGHEPLMCGTKVVLKLLKDGDCTEKWHRLYTDNWYTNMQVVKKMQTLKVHMTGTIKSNARGYPDAMKIKKNVLSEGDIIWRRQEEILALKYRDHSSAVVDLVSTTCLATESYFKSYPYRPEGQQHKYKPTVVQEYNKYMSGVDKVGQLIQYVTANRKTRKWYRKLIVHLLQVAANNAFVLCNKFGKKIAYTTRTKEKKERPYGHLEFLLKMVDSLLDETKEHVSARPRVVNLYATQETLSDQLAGGSQFDLNRTLQSRPHYPSKREATWNKKRKVYEVRNQRCLVCKMADQLSTELRIYIPKSKEQIAQNEKRQKSRKQQNTFSPFVSLRRDSVYLCLQCTDPQKHPSLCVVPCFRLYHMYVTWAKMRLKFGIITSDADVQRKVEWLWLIDSGAKDLHEILDPVKKDQKEYDDIRRELTLLEQQIDQLHLATPEAQPASFSQNLANKSVQQDLANKSVQQDLANKSVQQDDLPDIPAPQARARTPAEDYVLDLEADDQLLNADLHNYATNVMDMLHHNQYLDKSDDSL